jgi:hypothetical protein
MSKRILYLMIAVATIMTSCYDDYIEDFDYTSIYFPYQTDVRTVVVGEGMSFKVGVALGGTTDNTRDRMVDYTLDNNLITPAILSSMKSGANYIKNSVSAVTVLNPLPSNYYTLSNTSNIVIKSGEHSGTITVKVDSALFLADAATIQANYVLPFYISKADADTILKSRQYAIIGVKYENMLFGDYWHGGVTRIVRPNKADSVVTYRTEIPSLESKVWRLTTIAPNSLTTNGYSDKTNGKMTLTLDGNKVIVSSVASSTVVIEADGESTFNRAKLLQDRKIFLNYKYSDAAGNTYFAKDTLTFRNRVRDGVNEWQDENPSNY